MEKLREELQLRDDVTKALQKEIDTLKAKFEQLQEERVRAQMDAAHSAIDLHEALDLSRQYLVLSAPKNRAEADLNTRARKAIERVQEALEKKP